MKNFKKVLALVLAMTMVISTFAVSANETKLQNEDKAKKLYDLKLFQGKDAKKYVPDLESATNRQEAMVILSRMFGWDIDEDATTTFTDVDAWAVPYVAYAEKEEVTKGVGNDKFGAKDQVTKKELVAWITRLLGYGDAFEDLELAVTAKVITKEEKEAIEKAVKAETEAGLIRDDLVGIFWTALQTNQKDKDVSIIEQLIKDGKVDKEDAVDAGIFVEDFVVKGAKALNLVQTRVSFSQKADEVTAEEKDNYELEDEDKDEVNIKNVQLSEDGKEVVITHEKTSQQSKLKLTVSGVKNDKKDDSVEKFTEELRYLDTEVPKVEDVEVVGKDTIKVLFSEPMNADTFKKGNFEVEDGDLYIDDVEAANNDTEAIIVLYNDLDEGIIKVEISKDVTDAAGFGVSDTEKDVKVVEDKEAPKVVGFKNATLNRVTLVFNEKIEIAESDKENYYHTNSNNEVDDDVKSSNISTDGKELTLDFGDNPLPKGSAYVYILKDSINDLWDNKNAQIMEKIEVKEDKEAPTITKVKVKEGEEGKVFLTFSEELDEKSAEDIDNYTLLQDGKKQDKAIEDAEYDNENKEVTVEFKDTYTGALSIVVEDVKDLAGNKIKKTTEKFNADDTEDPEALTATLYEDGNHQVLEVLFSERMSVKGNYSVLDLSKYEVNGVRLDKVKKKPSIKSINNGTGVDIKIYDDSEDKNGDSFAVEIGKDLIVGRFADLEGNTTDYTDTLTIRESGDVSIETDSDNKGKIELTGKRKIKVTFTKPIDKINKNDLKDIVFEDNKDEYKVDDHSKLGSKEVTFTLKDDVKDGGYELYIKKFTAKNVTRHNEDLVVEKTPVKDKLKPTVKKDGLEADEDNNRVILEFSEKLKTGLTPEKLAADLSVGVNNDYDGVDFTVDYLPGSDNKLAINFNDGYWTKHYTNRKEVRISVKPNGDPRNIEDRNTNLMEKFTEVKVKEVNVEKMRKSEADAAEAAKTEKEKADKTEKEKADKTVDTVTVDAKSVSITGTASEEVNVTEVKNKFGYDIIDDVEIKAKSTDEGIATVREEGSKITVTGVVVGDTDVKERKTTITITVKAKTGDSTKTETIDVIVTDPTPDPGN